MTEQNEPQVWDGNKSFDTADISPDKMAARYSSRGRWTADPTPPNSVTDEDMDPAALAARFGRRRNW